MTISSPSTDHAIHRIGLGVVHHTLPKSDWTHAAHFAAALWLIRQSGIAQAIAEMPDIIRSYNVATGVANTDTGGYHATITLASMRAAAQVCAAHPDLPLADACQKLLAGPCGHPDWLQAYWSREKLFSVAARRGWMDPDIARFAYP